MWYRHQTFGLLNGHRPFNEDAHVLNFLNDVKGHKVVELYVEHFKDNEVVNDYVGDQVVPIEIDCDNTSTGSKVVGALKESVVVEVVNACEVERESVVAERESEVVIEVVNVFEIEREFVVGEVVVEVLNSSEVEQEVVVAEVERVSVVRGVEGECVVAGVEGERQSVVDGYSDEDNLDEDYVLESEEE